MCSPLSWGWCAGGGGANSGTCEIGGGGGGGGAKLRIDGIAGGNIGKSFMGIIEFVE